MGQADEGDQDLQTQRKTFSNFNSVCDMNDDNIIIKLLAVNPAHAYRVIGEIPSEVENVNLFMIDTGAAVSHIHEDILKRVAGSEPTLKAWTGCQLIGAERSPIEINGTAALILLIAGQKVYGEFLVTN